MTTGMVNSTLPAMIAPQSAWSWPTNADRATGRVRRFSFFTKVRAKRNSFQAAMNEKIAVAASPARPAGR